MSEVNSVSPAPTGEVAIAAGLSAKAPTPEYVTSWANMTNGIEDYARWQEMFKGRLGKDDPPFRRGRIWA